jgi:integrase
MGHTSKQMVYEVYGNYVEEGLEEDAEAIYHYFDQDFITPRKKESPIPFRYSTGHSLWVNSSNQSIPLSF